MCRWHKGVGSHKENRAIYPWDNAIDPGDMTGLEVQSTGNATILAAVGTTGEDRGQVVDTEEIDHIPSARNFSVEIFRNVSRNPLAKARALRHLGQRRDAMLPWLLFKFTPAPTLYPHEGLLPFQGLPAFNRQIS
jgi:hypothetical protein